MKTIWKYPVKATDRFEVMMPPGAKFLSVQIQDGLPQMWWMIDDEMPAVVTRVLRIIGTGHPIRQVNRLTFYATFQMQNGELVFHLFEEAAS